MTLSEHEAIESLALAALSSFGDDADETVLGALYYHATHSDYYTLLNVSQSCDDGEIRTALQRLRGLKPDGVVLVALANAEAVLLNPQLRNMYDTALSEP